MEDEACSDVIYQFIYLFWSGGGHWRSVNCVCVFGETTCSVTFVAWWWTASLFNICNWITFDELLTTAAANILLSEGGQRRAGESIRMQNIIIWIALYANVAWYWELGALFTTTINRKIESHLVATPGQFIKCVCVCVRACVKPLQHCFLEAPAVLSRRDRTVMFCHSDTCVF